MSALFYVTSVMIGTVLGITYGFAFCWTQKFLITIRTTKITACLAGVFSSLRIAVFAVILFCVLQIQSAPIILIVVPFVVTVWLVILKYKVLNGRR